MFVSASKQFRNNMEVSVTIRTKFLSLIFNHLEVTFVIFIHMCIILLATMLAPKVLNTAQKSALHILSDILLKRMKDHVCRRQEFVSAET